MCSTYPESRTLTIEETARRLGISRTLAYELDAADRLPVPEIRLGRRMVVFRAALDRALTAAPVYERRDGVSAARMVPPPTLPNISERRRNQEIDAWFG